MIDDARGQIDYHEQGSGPTILFVLGSWGTRSAWRAVIAALPARVRRQQTAHRG
jgi:pimeloyl-ACP methyl ester carboxylesterase